MEMGICSSVFWLCVVNICFSLCSSDVFLRGLNSLVISPSHKHIHQTVWRPHWWKKCATHAHTHTSTLRHWAGTSLKDWKQLKLSSAVALGWPVAARGELPLCISLSVSATHNDMRERALSETHCRTLIHAHPHRGFVSCWSFTSFYVLGTFVTLCNIVQILWHKQTKKSH